MRAPRLTRKVEYDTVPLDLTKSWADACANLLRETMRMMQEQDAEFADCWTHGVCLWNDGPVFGFGGSWDSVAADGEPIVAKAYLPTTGETDG